MSTAEPDAQDRSDGPTRRRVIIYAAVLGQG